MAEFALTADEPRQRHRERFLATLDGRLATLRSTLAGLRARPGSATNRQGLLRRVEAMADAARALGFDEMGAVFGESAASLRKTELPLDEAVLNRIASNLELVSALVPDRTGASAGLDPEGESGRETPLVTSGTDVEAEQACSLTELTERLQRELGVALLGTSDAAVRSQRLDVEVYRAARAVVWSAITKLRDVVSEGSNGAIEYPDRGPEGALLLPIKNRQGNRRTGNVELLRGRRVLVADDDPAVAWFLTSVLRSAGALVLEARDGLEAWNLAREQEPELIVSDVMMPRLDGFSLCRNLKRDVALGDVPVVLLSWKEDLLQRVRELGVGADGYLAKSTDAEVILERCAEALEARAHVERRIRQLEDGSVAGRLDGMTPRFILELAARSDRNVSIEFHDAGFVYQVAIVRGQLCSVQRRGQNESVENGKTVLTGLLGMRAGRFVVRPTSGDEDELPENSLGAVSEALEPHVLEIRRALHQVQGARLQELEKLEFDWVALTPYLNSSPPVVRKLIEKLANGVRPAALLRSVSAGLLESVLVDVAMRGAIVIAEEGGAETEDALYSPVDAEVKTPVPGMQLSRAPGAPRVGAQSTPEDVERAVLFADRLQARADSSRTHAASLSSSDDESAKPPQSGTSASDGSRQDHSMDPSARKDAPPSSETVSKDEWARLRQRVDQLMTEREVASVDLGEVVLVGVSATPSAPPTAVERKNESKEIKRTSRRVEALPSSAMASEPAKATRARNSGSAGDGLRGLRSAWGEARNYANGWIERSRALLAEKRRAAMQPLESTDVEDHDTEETLPPPGTQDDTEETLPAELPDADDRENAESAAAHNDSDAGQGRDVSRVAPAPGQKGSAPCGRSADKPSMSVQLKPADQEEQDRETNAAAALDDEAEELLDGEKTDPDWLPAVEPTEPRHSPPRSATSPRLATTVKRVVGPMAIVGAGACGAFALTGWLGTSLHEETRSPPKTVRVAESVPAEPEPAASGTGLSAAQALLDQTTSSDAPSGPESDIREPEPLASPDMHAVVMSLPDGVTVGENRGLLEVETDGRHRIYVGGVFVGRGPARRVPLSPGSYQVQTRLGDQARDYDVNIEAGRRTRLQPVKSAQNH